MSAENPRGAKPQDGSLFRRLFGWMKVDLHPACPICGDVVYVKSMPFHLSLHHRDDPDVIAWRNRG